MDLKNLPPHGGLLVFGKSRLKTQKLTANLNSDGVLTPNFFFLKSSPILKISAGDQHALFSSQNRTYAFGINDWGQLGIKQEMKQEVDKPVLIKPLKNIDILDISCGRSHNLVLTGNGGHKDAKTLYSFGSNTDSQLGIPGGQATSTPLSISTKTYPNFPKNVVKVASGSDFSVALTTDGVLYGWGDNDSGQLGDKSLEQEVQSPARIKLNATLRKNVGTVIDVVCGYHSTILLTSTGLALIAGENFGNDFKSLNTPEPVKLICMLGSGKIIFVGNLSGSVFISAEIDESQEGSNNRDLQFTKIPFSPQISPNNNNNQIVVQQLSAGYEHAAIITNNKHLYTFGDSNQGQLCHGNKLSSQDYFKKVTFCENELNFNSVCCGGSFTIISVSPKNSQLMKSVSFSGYEPDTEDNNLSSIREGANANHGQPAPHNQTRNNNNLQTIPEGVETAPQTSGGLFSSCKSKPKTQNKSNQSSVDTRAPDQNVATNTSTLEPKKSSSCTVL